MLLSPRAHVMSQCGAPSALDLNPFCAMRKHPTIAEEARYHRERGWTHLRLSEPKHGLGDFICQLLPAYRLLHSSRVENADLDNERLSLPVSDRHREISAQHTCLPHDAYPGHCQARSERVKADSEIPQTSSLIVIVGLLFDSNTRSSLSLN